MWMLSIFSIPDWIYHFILGTGLLLTLVGFTLGFIPWIKQYLLPIKVFGILILSVGLYFEGRLAVKKELEQDIAELKVKLAEAEAKSEKVNTKIVTKVIREKEVVKEKGDSIIEYVDREVVKYNDKCPLPQSVIIAHDAAAQNKKIDEVLTPNSILKTDEHNRAAQSNNQLILPKK
jgi:hypothetical protein